MIGLAAGIATGVILVASRTGEIEPGRAAAPYRGIVYATDYISGGDGKSYLTGWTGWENAIGALVSTRTSGGGTVYFPTGIYKVTESVIVPRHVKLEGMLGTFGERHQDLGNGAVLYRPHTMS